MPDDDPNDNDPNAVDPQDVPQRRTVTTPPPPPPTTGDKAPVLRPTKAPKLSDTERNALLQKLADAKPTPFVPTPIVARAPVGELTSRWKTKIETSNEEVVFPTLDPGSKATTGLSTVDTYAFKLVVKTVDQNAYTVKVLVTDGEINGEFPTGMTGADDYFLTLAGAADGTEIWAVITYDTSTLAITSRTLDFGVSVPDSTYGTLYVGIGYVDWEFAPGSGAIINVVPHNRQCGDINIAFIYGAMSGAPALFTLSQYADPVLVT